MQTNARAASTKYTEYPYTNKSDWWIPREVRINALNKAPKSPLDSHDYCLKKGEFVWLTIDRKNWTVGKVISDVSVFRKYNGPHWNGVFIQSGELCCTDLIPLYGTVKPDRTDERMVLKVGNVLRGTDYEINKTVERFQNEWRSLKAQGQTPKKIEYIPISQVK